MIQAALLKWKEHRSKVLDDLVVEIGLEDRFIPHGDEYEDWAAKVH